MTIGHFLSTGERLFEKIYVRCMDVASVGLRVFVGRFAADGLRVYDFLCDDHRLDGLGVSASRKPA